MLKRDLKPIRDYYQQVIELLLTPGTLTLTLRNHHLSEGYGGVSGRCRVTGGHSRMVG